MGRIRFAQNKEVMSFSKKVGSLHVRCRYSRSRETQQANDIGQDYMVYRYSRNEIAFCICDGVSLSFYGNIAAKLLGDALTDYMWTLGSKVYNSADDLGGQMRRYLQQLTWEASEIVRNYRIPRRVQGILRDVLEEKRFKGSESTFVCGKVLFTEHGIQNAALSWIGDTRIRLWSYGHEFTNQLGGQFSSSERWSTFAGVIGQGPYVYVSDAASWPISRIQVYTDGLGEFDSWSKTPTDQELNEMMESCLSKPNSDDISFLELGVTVNDISG